MSKVTYVYKTKSKEYKEIFENGIVFFDTKFSLTGSFDKVEDVKEYLKEMDSDYMAFVIEIPESFMKTKSVDGKRIPPYPILFEREMIHDGEIDFYPVVVPSLIAFAYNPKTDPIVNPNYSVKYNPSGLKYSEEQLLDIRRKNKTPVTPFDDRNRKDPVELYREESKKSNTLWNSLLGHYGNPDTEPFASKGDLPRVQFEKVKTKKLNNKKSKKGKGKKNRYEEEY